ncbi:hypothetical protein SuUB23_18810 [Streptococcus uberis]
MSWESELLSDIEAETLVESEILIDKRTESLSLCDIESLIACEIESLMTSEVEVDPELESD